MRSRCELQLDLEQLPAKTDEVLKLQQQIYVALREFDDSLLAHYQRLERSMAFHL